MLRRLVVEIGYVVDVKCHIVQIVASLKPELNFVFTDANSLE